jgi:predicted DNA-binding protein YlxM (UPF0122 family)
MFETIIKMYSEGVPVSEIASKVGLSTSTLYQIFKKEKITLRRQDGVSLQKHYLIKEFLENNKSIEEIASNKNTNVDAIKKALVRFRIVSDVISDSKNELLNWISPIQEQLIKGSLLGDASIELHRNKGRLKIEHGLKQKDYVELKYNILKNFVQQPPKIFERFDKRTNKNYQSVSFRTETNPIFNDIHSLFYKNKLKIVSEEVLNSLDDRGLAFWFQDDGFKNENLLGISTDCFSEEDINNCIKWFKSRWKIESYTRNKRIYFQGINALILSKILEPNIIPTLKYKLL